MKLHAPTLFTAAGLAAALLASPAAGQVVVKALEQEGAPKAEAAGVRLVRYAEAAEAGPVTVGTPLAGGDLLSADAAGPSVELACPEGSLLRLAPPFRVAVLPPRQEAGCAVDLLAGTIEVVAAGATEIRSGTLAVRGVAARYALRLEPAERASEAGGGRTAVGVSPAAATGVRQRVLVLDGAVEVSSPAGRTRVPAGRFVTVEAPRDRPDLARMQGGSLAPAEVEQWAGGTPPWPEPQPTAEPEPAESALAEAVRAPPSEAVGVEEPTAQAASGEPAAPAAPAQAQVSQPPAAPAQAQVSQPLAAVPATPPLDRDELRRWLDAQRYEDVIAAIEPRVAAGSLGSVDYYLLAQACAGLRRFDRSAVYARRALRLDEVDDLLTSRELAAAQNLKGKGSDESER